MTINQILKGKPGWFLALVMAAPLSLLGQTATTIEVTDHRPLSAALAKLQEATGVAINYEDIPYEHASDLEDVSTPAQKALSPTYRLMVPRKGTVKLTVSPQARGSLSQTLTSVYALLDSYRAAGMPGDFKVTEANGMIYVAATKVLGRAGTMRDMQPIMETVVTIPATRTRAIDCVQLIMRAVSASTQAKVAVGSFPHLAAAPVSCSASQESASYALAQLLSKLTAGATSYDLLFDPVAGYMLNLRFLPVEAKAATNAPQTAPASGSPFFVKQKN